jgi:hypothetical protein
MNTLPIKSVSPASARLRLAIIMSPTCFATFGTSAAAPPASERHDVHVTMNSSVSAPTLHTVSEHVTIDRNFLETGHTLMRRVDGNLNAVVIADAEGQETLRYLISVDEGMTWKSVDVPSSGGSREAALDANEFGTYIAYVSTESGHRVGHVTRVKDPLGNAQMLDSGPITEGMQNNQYSSIAASRLGLKSVAFGWFDPTSGAINVGVSLDGVNFPTAKTIATDKHAQYGPAVAVFGKYVVVTYQTTNSAITPTGATHGAYVAWLESADGGATWTAPQALFGRNSNLLPTYKARAPDKSPPFISVRLTGITNNATSFIQPLVWEQPTIAQSRVFITSPMSYAIQSTSADNANTIGVVSFKMPRKGGKWTHVVADSMNRSGIVGQGGDINPNGTFHQYSALPGTPLRVVTYIDHSSETSEQSLVAAISADNAQHFVRAIRYRASDLGFSSASKLALRSSLCLWRDRDGSVSLDTFLASEVAGSGRLIHAKIPLGIHLTGGEAVTASNW